MKIGIMFPQTEIQPDVGEIREFAQAIERMGFNHLLAIDHVLGANKASRPQWSAPYSSESTFYEPFVLLPTLIYRSVRAEPFGVAQDRLVEALLSSSKNPSTRIRFPLTRCAELQQIFPRACSHVMP